MIAVAVLLGGCTQNHGHIGRLFGSWYLYAMTCNGAEEDIAVYGDTFWSFQSNLIMMTTESEHYQVHKSYGTWTETDDALILDFSYTYEDTSADNAYNPPVWIGLPKAADIVLEYMVKSNKDMSLRYVDAEGNIYEYFLRKTY